VTIHYRFYSVLPVQWVPIHVVLLPHVPTTFSGPFVTLRYVTIPGTILRFTYAHVARFSFNFSHHYLPPTLLHSGFTTILPLLPTPHHYCVRTQGVPFTTLPWFSISCSVRSFIDVHRLPRYRYWSTRSPIDCRLDTAFVTVIRRTSFLHYGSVPCRSFHRAFSATFVRFLEFLPQVPPAHTFANTDVSRTVSRACRHHVLCVAVLFCSATTLQFTYIPVAEFPHRLPFYILLVYRYRFSPVPFWVVHLFYRVVPLQFLRCSAVAWLHPLRFVLFWLPFVFYRCSTLLPPVLVDSRYVSFYRSYRSVPFLRSTIHVSFTPLRTVSV